MRSSTIYILKKKKKIDQVSDIGKFQSPGAYVVLQDQSFKGYNPTCISGSKILSKYFNI